MNNDGRVLVTVNTHIAASVGERVQPARRPASYQEESQTKATPAMEGRRPPHSGGKSLFSSYIPRTMTPKEETHPATEVFSTPLLVPGQLL